MCVCVKYLYSLTFCYCIYAFLYFQANRSSADCKMGSDVFHRSVYRPDC